MPPLRARLEDVPLLVDYFLDQLSRKLGTRRPIVAEEVLAWLQGYSWPGNVRELANIIERALVLSGGEPITIEHLPKEMASAASLQQPASLALPARELALSPAVENLEKALIIQALQQAGDHKAKAARLLDISERALWDKIKKYRLS